MTKKAIRAAILAMFVAGCASTTLSRQERIADVVTCLATAAAAGADVLLLIASPASDSSKAVDVVRKIQEATQTSSILLAIPACAKVYANEMQVIAENRAKAKTTLELRMSPDAGIRVIPDLK